MLKVFSCVDITEAVLVKDALVHHGIEVTTPNEYSGQSAVPGFRPPAEVWITRDSDLDAARRVVTDTLSTLDNKSVGPQWVCTSCGTDNPPSFELCWHCGKDRGSHGR
jgi:hypothetical protein